MEIKSILIRIQQKKNVFSLYKKASVNVEGHAISAMAATI